MTKTSEPRTFSSIWQNVSPSEKLNDELRPGSRVTASWKAAATRLVPHWVH